MAIRRDEPFPLEAVRDLLGVVRAIYAAAKRAGADKAELARIAAIGKDLSLAIDLAASTRPGTVGYRAAYDRAEEATRRAGKLVDALTPAEPLMGAAQGRVIGARAALKPRREER